MSVSQTPETVNDVLAGTGIKTDKKIHYQETPEQLSNATVERGEGVLNDTGALVIKTGEFTGRSPKDKFIVKDEMTADTVDWNDFNIPIDTEELLINMHKKLVNIWVKKRLWVRDCLCMCRSEIQVEYPRDK